MRPWRQEATTETFAADGKTITGRWEIAEAGEDWRTDFDARDDHEYQRSTDVDHERKRGEGHHRALR